MVPFIPQLSRHLPHRRVLGISTLLLTAALGGTPVQAANDNDRLRTPPLSSEMAARSLLLDITPVGDRLLSVGERGHVLYSDNGGLNWQQAEVPLGVTLTAVYFIDNQHGWATGHDGVILHSRDGGESWSKQLDGNQIARLQQDAARDQVKALSAQLALDSENEDLQYALEDAEIALEDAQAAAEEGPGSPLLDIWFKDSREGIAIGAYGTLLLTRDGGQSWHTAIQPPRNPDRFHLNSIASLGNGELVVAGEAGALFHSSDNGQRWQPLESPYEGSYFGVTAMTDRSLILFGLRGNAFRSSDSGQSWHKLQVPGSASLFASARNGNQLILAAANGTL